MSFVDGRSGSDRKALTGGLVVLIQGGLAIALINGFAVTVLETDPPPRLAGEQIRLDPIPPQPTPDPTTEPERPVTRDPVEVPRVTKTPIDTNKPVVVASDIPTFPTGDVVSGDDFTFSEPPAKAAPRFTPRAARPSNDAAGWVTTSDYPTREIRAGHQGTVRFELAIDARGGVSRCTIVASSGYPGLDEATCKFVSRRARFEPATNGDGERVGDTYSGTIRWVIPRD